MTLKHESSSNFSLAIAVPTSGNLKQTPPALIIRFTVVTTKTHALLQNLKTIFSVSSFI
jgi:hypothetical protein